MSLPFFRNQCPNWNVLFQINFRDELRCGQEDFSSQTACVKGLCVTSLQPWKPRGFAKLHLSTGSVPELECFVLLHCSLGFNFLILKFAMFSSHRQAGEEYCEWAVTISTGRGKVTALGDLLAANLKIHMSGGSLGTVQNSTGAMILANVREKGCLLLGCREQGWTWVSISDVWCFVTVAFYKNVISNLMSAKCCSTFRIFYG